MLDKIIHINSNNEKLDFNALGVYVNYNDLRDFEWDVYVNAYNKITGFNRGIVTKTIPFVFLVNNSDAIELKNRFYEHFEVDVLNAKKGYFEINGYRYYCYATKSVKSNYLIDKRLLMLEIEITTDDAFWIKEKVYGIDFNDVNTVTDALRYAFTYPFTYTSGNSVNISTESFAESDAIIRIYGKAVNPLVKIGNNVYQVNITLLENEYIEIDTANATIYRYSKFGDVSNCFNYRNKDYDVFRRLPSGVVNVSANDKLKVDIVIIERRGEPKWI